MQMLSTVLASELAGKLRKECVCGGHGNERAAAGDGIRETN